MSSIETKIAVANHFGLYPLQCNGVCNGKSNSQYLKDKRCKVLVRTDTHSMFSKNCKNPNKDMCFMHCDCSFCSTYYLETKNRGLRWDETEQEKGNISTTQSILKSITNSTNIEKLKCLLIAVSENICLDSYIPKAKENYRDRKRNKEIMTKIESLEKEIKKLKEEII